MSQVILYGHPISTFVWIARLCLEEKGVDYQLVELAPQSLREEPHLSRHPFGRIPAFEHDDFKLYETDAVARYVDDAFPGPALQPADPRRRARMNQVIGIHDSYGAPALGGGIVFNRRVAPLIGFPIDEAAVAAAVPQAALCLKEWERLLGEQTFFTGDQISLADLWVLPLVYNLKRTPEGATLLPQFPHLSAWLARMEQRDSVKKTAALP
jgi:glutathione S-transferase